MRSILAFLIIVLLVVFLVKGIEINYSVNGVKTHLVVKPFIIYNKASDDED